MTKLEALQAMIALAPDMLPDALIRALQTAQQIGSSWPKDNINLLYLSSVNAQGEIGYYRLVME